MYAALVRDDNVKFYEFSSLNSRICYPVSKRYEEVWFPGSSPKAAVFPWELLELNLA